MRHLSLLVALADHGTTHRAADALNMTQSTASKMLRDIEDVLGATLFERGPRGLVPSPLGDFAIRSARRQLSRLRRFADEFEVLRAGGYGTLTVGAITGAAPDFVAHAVAEIKRKRPQLMVTLHGETSEDILAQLEVGGLDLAVGRFSTERHRDIFDFEHLADEHLAFVVRADHPLAERGITRLDQLDRCAWALQPRSNPTRQVLEAAFDRAGMARPTDSIECSSILLLLNLVQVSDAVALLPKAVVHAHIRAGLLRAIQIRPAVLLTGFGLVTRSKEGLSDAALEFCDILRARAARYAPPAQEAARDAD